MGGDEEATLATLTAHRKIIDSLIGQHHGRFVNSAGDSVLAEFASVVDAVNSAVDIQTTLTEPVRVFRVLLEPGVSAVFGRQKPRSIRKHWRTGAWLIAGLALLVGVVVLVQHLSMRAPEIAASIPPEHNWIPPLPNMPSIAVLPFSNLSGDPRQEYFSDGITAELITDLSRLNSLFVIASTSSFTYKNRSVKVQEIGRELGVKYLLEGSVLRADNRVRLDTQLVEASTGANLWAGRFDRPLTDVLAVQDDVLQKIVTTLNLQ